jgi:hypothetical protein
MSRQHIGQGEVWTVLASDPRFWETYATVVEGDDDE